jgi:deazaflavin-dependent oxidoreductase (nitroreductase family)
MPGTQSPGQRVIDEFRSSGGAVGGMFAGVPLILLITAGRKTGRPRVNPVTYLKDGERYLVFGSNLGGPAHPDWYHNLVASPQVTIEYGAGDGRVTPLAARAEILAGAERDRWYERQCSISPVFREYQERTTRVIPVIALYPLDLSGDPTRRAALGEQLMAHHNDLRAALTRVRAVLDGRSADSPDLAEQLRQRCLSYCYGLRLHHIREDGAFTAFERRFPHLVPAIDALRAEHEAIGRALDGLQARLDSLPPTDALAALDETVSDLERHFAEEERIFTAVED